MKTRTLALEKLDCREMLAETYMGPIFVDMVIDEITADQIVVTGTARDERCGNFLVAETITIDLPEQDCNCEPVIVADPVDLDPVVIVVEAATTTVTITTPAEIYSETIVTPEGDVDIVIGPTLVDASIPPAPADPVVADLEQQVADLEAENADLVAQVEQLEEDRAEITALIQTMNALNVELTTQLDQALAANAEIEAQRQALEASYNDLVTALEQQITELQGLIPADQVAAAAAPIDTLATDESGDASQFIIAGINEPYIGYPMIPSVFAGPCPDFCPPVDTWADYWTEAEWDLINATSL